jgi:predicted nucleic acid-binding protein
LALFRAGRMAGVVVLDASALIALHDSEDRHHTWARGMFLDTIDATLAMSVLTYAEVLVHPTRAGKVVEFEQNIAGLGIEIVTVGAEDAPALALLRESTSLKMPVVIVLHLAAGLGASLATTDRELAGEAALLGLTVLEPQPV